MPWNTASNHFAQAATLCNVFLNSCQDTDTKVPGAIKSDWILIKWGRLIEIKWNKGALECLWAQSAVKCNCQSGNSQDHCAISNSPSKIKCLRPFCQDATGSKHVSTSGTPIYSFLRIGGRLCQTSAYGGPPNSKRDPPKEESYLPTFFWQWSLLCLEWGHCPFDSEVSWVHSSLAPKQESDHVKWEIPSPNLEAHHALGSEFLLAQGESAVQTLVSPNKFIDDSKGPGNKGHINYSVYTSTYVVNKIVADTAKLRWSC